MRYFLYGSIVAITLLGATRARAADAIVTLDGGVSLSPFTVRGYSGQLLNNGTGTPVFEPIVLVMEMDAETDLRAIAAAAGTVFNNGDSTIDVQDGGSTVLTITLKNARIVRFALVANAEGDGNPREQLSLVYTQIRWTIPGGPSTCWDLSTNVACP